MLPIILDIPIIIDEETYKETIAEINKIENQTMAIDSYWKLIKSNGGLILPSTAVFWLFFWADTKGKEIARQVFRNIFNIRYEEFYNELDRIKPGFKTDGRKNNSVRESLKESKKTSDETIKKIIENFYKIILSSDINEKENIEKLLEEQDTIISQLRNISNDKLDTKIKEMQNLERKQTTGSYAKTKRNQYLMELYKKKRDYECQLCRKKIKKANGNYYIEACHIKAIEDGGTDNVDNILILCPNCHKEFDYGKREEPKWCGNILSIIIDGVEYKVEY